MSKICVNCGREADDNAKFCACCGARFPKAEEGPTEDVSLRAEEECTAGEAAGKEFSAPQGGAPQDAPPAEEKKIGAEWQGSDCRRFGDEETPAGPSTPFYGNPYAPQPLSPQEYEAQRLKAVAQAKRRGALNARKTLFALAFVGLLLDFVCGIGFLVCLPVAVTATVFSALLYGREKKTSAQLIWAMVIGYIGAFLGLVFFILMV